MKQSPVIIKRFRIKDKRNRLLVYGDVLNGRLNMLNK